mmetsp:Transcript_77000/g.214080  ORF Transcript_77000/g.214080 Transcript_77000/m.214080 type:complete len:273 (+) Transcript_77000:291-1109(+)
MLRGTHRRGARPLAPFGTTPLALRPLAIRRTLPDFPFGDLFDEAVDALEEHVRQGWTPESGGSKPPLRRPPNRPALPPARPRLPLGQRPPKTTDPRREAAARATAAASMGSVISTAASRSGAGKVTEAQPAMRSRTSAYGSSSTLKPPTRFKLSAKRDLSASTLKTTRFERISPFRKKRRGTSLQLRQRSRPSAVAPTSTNAPRPATRLILPSSRAPCCSFATGIRGGGWSAWPGAGMGRRGGSEKARCGISFAASTKVPEGSTVSKRRPPV